MRWTSTHDFTVNTRFWKNGEWYEYRIIRILLIWSWGCGTKSMENLVLTEQTKVMWTNQPPHNLSFLQLHNCGHATESKYITLLLYLMGGCGLKMMWKQCVEGIFIMFCFLLLKSSLSLMLCQGRKWLPKTGWAAAPSILPKTGTMHTRHLRPCDM